MRFETSTLVAVAAVLSVAGARPHGGAAGQVDGQGSAAGAGTGAGAAAGAGGDSLLSGLMAGLSSLLGGAIPTGGAGFSGFGSGGNGVYLTGGVAVPTGGLGAPAQGGGFFGVGFTTEVSFGNGDAVPTAGAGQDAFNQPPGRIDAPPPGPQTPTATGGSGVRPTGAVQPSFGGSAGGVVGGEDHPGIATPTSEVPRVTPTATGANGGISTPATTAPAALPVNTINWSTFSFVFASTAAPGGRNGGFIGNGNFGGSGGFGGSDGSAGFLNGLFGKKRGGNA